MRTRTVSVVIDNHGRSMTGSRVEGAESRSLLGRQKSGRFKGGVPGRRPSSGGDMEEGCCNKCLADVSITYYNEVVVVVVVAVVLVVVVVVVVCGVCVCVCVYGCVCE